MKTRILITLFALGCALPSARAQLIVEDPISIAQDAIDSVIDLGQYVEMVSNQVQQLNTLTQELQQVTAYVKAFGDPATLLEIVGVNELVASLQQSGIGQTIGAIRETASGIEALKNNAEGLYQDITDISLSGIAVPRVEDFYKPFAALENASSNYTAVYDDVMQRRQVLKGLMVSTVNQLQAATTDAEAQKLQGVVTAQAAELQAIDQEVAVAASQTVVQDISNRNNAEKQQQARNEELAAERHDAFTKFGGMMLPDVKSELRFGTSKAK